MEPPDSVTAGPTAAVLCRVVSPCGMDTVTIVADEGDRTALAFTVKNLDQLDERFTVQCWTQGAPAACDAVAQLDVPALGSAVLWVWVTMDAGGFGAVNLRVEPTINVRDGGRGKLWVWIRPAALRAAAGG